MRRAFIPGPLMHRKLPRPWRRSFARLFVSSAFTFQHQRRSDALLAVQKKYKFPHHFQENLSKMFKNVSIFFALLACCILSANCGCVDREESDGGSSAISGWFKKLGCGITAKVEEARDDFAKVKEVVEDGMQKIGDECSSTEDWMDKIGCGLKSGAEKLKEATENEVKKMDHKDTNTFYKKFRGIF